MNEQEYVIQQFQKAFAKWKDASFVLYGLGKNTEAILKQTEGFRFVGLMDAKNTGKEFWGLRVLSEKEILTLRPKIVIIARKSVIPIIYARISYLQEEHGLSVYDFEGKRPGNGQTRYSNQNLQYWKITEENMIKAIQNHACISFDIFDTLLMRKVLEPTDVFGIVERILEEKGYVGNHFYEYRIQAEKSLANYPLLTQIYEEMGRKYNIPNDVLEEWRELEVQVEKRVIVPRRNMVWMFRYALEQGKKVFLISDMYFSEKELEGILIEHGIEGYNGLLVSCEYQKGKEDGSLFQEYKRVAKEESYLHIGDNRYSDGQNAQKCGLDTFQIYSAYEIWLASSMQSLLIQLDSLEQRCILGNLIWKCCENPFALHKGKGILVVDEPEELGYIFLGALYDEFIVWLLQKLAEEKVEQLLLPSRDGFLIDRMLAEKEELFFDTVYFKASRRAVSVASMWTEQDILFLVERGFQGTFGELLWQRYGIKPKKDDIKKGYHVKERSVEEVKAYVLSYKIEILQNAEREREEYLTYLNSLGIYTKKKQAIFDFVASGTVHYFLQKLLGVEWKGFYFATMNHPNEKYHLEDNISSAYGNICSYETGNQVAKHYIFLETVMVDGNPTLRCVEDGNFVYESKELDNDSIVHKVQEGILNYQHDMHKMRELVPNWRAEINFADRIFGKLFAGSCQVSRIIKQGFFNDDIFDGVKAYSAWSE